MCAGNQKKERDRKIRVMLQEPQDKTVFVAWLDTTALTKLPSSLGYFVKELPQRYEICGNKINP